MKKRLLSMVLALVMLLSLIPTTAWAGQPALSKEEPVIVATIGDVTYTDLHEALVACKSGETVTLLDDVDLTGTSWTPVGDATMTGGAYTNAFKGTLDGNGHTITGLKVSGGSQVGLIGFMNGGTVKNLTVTGADIDGTGNQVGVIAGGAFFGTIDNVKVLNSTVDGAGQYTGAIVGGSVLTIKNSEATGNIVTGKDQVGGIIGYLASGSVKDCTANNTVTATEERAGGIAGKCNTDSEFFVNGNAVSGTISAPDYAGGVAAQIMGGSNNYGIKNNTITGVTLNAPEISPIATIRKGQDKAFTDSLASNTSGNTWNLTTSEAFEIKESYGEDSQIPVYNVYTAKIGADKYATLAEAVAAAKNGDTITMIYDEAPYFSSVYATVSGNKSITLDLNGHTVNGTSRENGYTSLLKVENGSALTVKDSAGSGSLQYTDSKDNTGGTAIECAGSLTLESGTVENKTVCVNSAIQAAVDVHANEWGSTYYTTDTVFTMTGGALKSQNDNTLRLYDSSQVGSGKVHLKATISGGSITGADAVFIMPQWTTQYVVNQSTEQMNPITVNVTGGTFVTKNGIRVCGNAGTENAKKTAPIQINVTGGTFTTTDTAKYRVYDVAFQETAGWTSTEQSTEKLRSYVRINGRQAIVPVAKIDDTEYPTLAKAVAAAQEGDTIELVANVVLDDCINCGNKSFTLDGKGYTVSRAETLNGTPYSFFNFGAQGGGAGKTYAVKNVILSGLTGTTYMFRVESCGMTLDNVDFKNCDGTYVTIFTHANATVTDCEFVGNSAQKRIIDFNSNANEDGENDVLVIDNCLFKGNVASGTAIVGIAEDKSVTVTNSTFEANTLHSSNNGAPLYLGDRCSTCTGCLFKDNVVNYTTTVDYENRVRAAGAIFTWAYGTPKGEITGNAFVNNSVVKKNDNVLTCYAKSVYSGGYYAADDLCGNYWGGSAPVIAQKNITSAGNDVYAEYDAYGVTASTYGVSYTANTANRGVTVAVAVAEVQDKGYASLADAVKAAGGSKAVKLLADADATGIAGSYIVSTNGYELDIAEGYAAAKIGTNLSIIGKNPVSVGNKLTAGTFTIDPKAYIADGYVVTANAKTGTYTVEKPEEEVEAPAIVVDEPVDSEVSSAITDENEKTAAEAVVDAISGKSTTGAASGMEITGAGVTNASTELIVSNAVTAETSTEQVTYQAEGVTSTETKNVTEALEAALADEVNDEDVAIVIQTYSKVSVVDVTLDAALASITEMTVDIVPMYQKIATTKEVAEQAKTDASKLVTSSATQSDVNAVKVGVAAELDVTEPVIVTIPLPANFANANGEQYANGATLYVKHIKEDGTTYIYAGTVTNDATGYYVSFVNPNGFSEFVVMGENSTVAQIGEVNYGTLASAVGAVQNGETIKLVKSSDETVTVDRAVSFTFNLNGKAFTGSISAGTGYYREVEDGVYTFADILAPTAVDFVFSSPENLYFDGKAKTATVVTATDVEGMGEITVKYYNKNGEEVAEPVNPGTYTVKIDVAAGSHYYAAENVTSDSWKFTVIVLSSGGSSSSYVSVVSSMPLLRQGNTGSDVKTLQAKLNALGYNCGDVDGVFGAKTYAAVVKFQTAMGITADGVVGKVTWSKLGVIGTGVAVAATTQITKTTGNMPLVRSGNTGDDVKTLQTKLNALGYTCAVDGIFGSETYKAVTAFQTAKGLTVDGIVGAQTWSQLG